MIKRNLFFFCMIAVLCLSVAACDTGAGVAPDAAESSSAVEASEESNPSDTASHTQTVQEKDHPESAGSADATTADNAKADAAAADTSAPEGVNETDETISFIRFETVHHEMHEEVTQEKEDEPKRISLSYDTILTGKKLKEPEETLPELDRVLVSQEWARERDYMNRFSSVEVAMNRAEGAYVFSLSQRLRVFRADSRVFSYLVESMEMLDDGGKRTSAADDRYSCLVYNIDPETGRAIALNDVVNDTEKLITLAAQAVTEKYVDRNPAFTAQEQFEGVDLEEQIREMVTGEAKEESASFFAWSPCYYGLRLIFARDMLVDPQGYRSYLEEVSSVEPRDLKKVEVVIPYSAAPEIFTPAYTALPASYMAELEPGVGYVCDFGDGPVSFLVNAPRKFENKTILYTGEYTIRTGTDRQSFNTVGAEAYSNYGTKVYLVKTEDGTFLYLDAQYENETDRLHVYAYGDGTFSFTGVSGEMLDAERMPPFDPASFTVEGIFLILPNPFDPEDDGTRALRHAYVSENGMPKSDERVYRVVEEDIRTTRIDLMLDTLKDASAAVPVKELYPAGTILRMTGISPASHADFEAGDGRIVRMYINGVDTIDLIDGHEIHDAFADTRKPE